MFDIAVVIIVSRDLFLSAFFRIDGAYLFPFDSLFFLPLHFVSLSFSHHWTQRILNLILLILAPIFFLLFGVLRSISIQAFRASAFLY